MVDSKQLHQLDAAALALGQPARAELIAHHDARRAADAVADAADQVADHGGHGVGRGGVDAHVAHDGGIGCKADPPEE